MRPQLVAAAARAPTAPFCRRCVGRRNPLTQVRLGALFCAQSPVCAPRRERLAYERGAERDGESGGGGGRGEVTGWRNARWARPLLYLQFPVGAARASSGAFRLLTGSHHVRYSLRQAASSHRKSRANTGRSKKQTGEASCMPRDVAHISPTVCMYYIHTSLAWLSGCRRAHTSELICLCARARYTSFGNSFRFVVVTLEGKERGGGERKGAARAQERSCLVKRFFSSFFLSAVYLSCEQACVGGLLSLFGGPTFSRSLLCCAHVCL